MKAYVLQNIGDISLKDVPEPIPGEREVIVKVRASGICGSDIPRIFQNGAHNMPLIPGHEFSGEVIMLGKKADKRFLNRRVGVFPLIPCRKCVACKKGSQEICENYNYLGSRRDGGFAEFVAVPERNLIELPDKVSFERAAMLEPMAVAVHAMRRTLPCEEDTITVCGLGTIGLLLIMFLKEAGFKNIFAIGNKDSQKEAVLKLGILEVYFFDKRKGDESQWLMEKTNGLGTDVFFECVGKDETISQAINMTAAAGKVCLVGNPFSDIVIQKDIYWKVLRNQLTITGTWNSSFTGKENDDWHYVLERLSSDKLLPEKLISHRFSLEDLVEGFRIMKGKREDYIKIMGIF